MSNLYSAFLWAAEEEAHEPTGLDLVLPDPAELIYGSLAFALVLIALMKFVFPKIRKAVEERERQIQSELTGAETSKTEAEQTLQQYKSQLADARSEANRVIEEARQSAEQVRKDLIARAEADAQGVVARAQEQIEAERTRTVSELKGEVARLAVDLAEKVVGKSLDRSTQSQLVDDYIRDLGATSGNGSTRA